MDALRQSLDRVSTGKKKTAKVIEEQPAARQSARQEAGCSIKATTNFQTLTSKNSQPPIGRF